MGILDSYFRFLPKEHRAALEKEITYSDLNTKSIILTVNSFSRGVTAPTDGTVGSTPTISTLIFDSVLEKASASLVMPPDWDKTYDCEFLAVVALIATETVGDRLDIDISYVAPCLTPATGLTRESSSGTMSVTVNTEQGNSAGDVYILRAPIPHDDPINPFTGGAWGLSGEFGLGAASEVSGFQLVSACVSYTPVR